MIRSLWTSIQGDPIFLRQAHGWLTLFWIANYPPVIALYLLVSNEAFQAFCLFYLALVSIYANVAGELAAWQASRVEVRQDEIQAEQSEQNPGKMES